MLNPPKDIVDFCLLEALPGWSRDDIRNEDPGFIQRVLIILDERGKEQAAQARRAKAGW